MNEFQEKIVKLAKKSVALSYSICKYLPKDELYGASSQLKRATFSILLNYVEGYARRKRLVKLNFYETSYGSCQESKMIAEVIKELKLVPESLEEIPELEQTLDELAKMLWSEITMLDDSKDV